MIKIRILSLFIILNLLLTAGNHAVAVPVRIKDIVFIEGIRDNLLIGYGLVVGLNGTGDNLGNNAFTQKGLEDFLERLGINTRGAALKPKNTAAVIVTATLPPFSRQGSRIDVAVSALGDAKSLQDGMLLATPLLGADGEVYAVSQGQISVSGFIASNKSDTTVVSRNVPTSGSIPNGAIIEKEISFNFNAMSKLKLALRNPDISTAQDIALVINHHLERNIATALDPGTVELTVPPHEKNLVNLLAEIEKLRVEPDVPAKILIDQGSGTIVVGENVRINPIAVSQGNLTVMISQQTTTETPPTTILGAGSAAAVAPPTTNTTTNIGVQETGKGLAVVKSGTTLQELVDGLNALGVGPRDLISILENIKAAGALHADITTR